MEGILYEVDDYLRLFYFKLSIPHVNGESGGKRGKIYLDMAYYLIAGLFGISS